MTLDERKFRCHACGIEMDRDSNAAVNLLRVIVDENLTVSSTAYHACGEESSGSHFHVGETSLGLKQDPERDQI
jgi:putative transposase